jgi:hypothetical protein
VILGSRALPLLVLLVSQPSAAEPAAIRWLPQASPPAVEVTGLPARALREIEKAALSPGAWSALFVVNAEQPEARSPDALPPMAGTWRVAAGGIRFEPRFPFSPAVRYRAEFSPARLPGGAPDAPPVVSYFALRAPAAARTTVTQVYPSGDVLPENQLKFYLQFSGPMSGGGIYEHITLRDASGADLDKPFLELDEELWDPTMTRLTVLIDPGRIKREVKPHGDIGPVFHPGRSYTLTVRPGWRDAAGQPLQAGFSKTYRIAGADRTPPDTARWQLRSPRSATRDPLVVEFDEPMDSALALRMITVAAPGGPLGGEASLERGEQRWKFVPAQPWRSGPHRLLVVTTIEDLAGNNIGKAFDLEIARDARRGLPAEKVAVPFEIK